MGPMPATGMDFMVIASHKPGLADQFPGSTAAQVVRIAPCSVPVLRRGPALPAPGLIRHFRQFAAGKHVSNSV